MKILSLKKLAQTVTQLKKEGKKIVHCHGCFDLMHPGHIKYFQAAKKMGNLLIVTVTPDKYVDKGPGRPVFNQNLRAESIAALECVDYVAINKWPTAEKTLKLLRPDVYVKGQEFEKLKDKTGKIQKEAKIVNQIGAKLKFTHGIVFSSTQLIKQYYPLITPINSDNNASELRESKNGYGDDQRTYKIIGAAMNVHKELGNGFLEPVYQEALQFEFNLHGVHFSAQPDLEIYYKGKLLNKKYQPDYICFNDIIVEIKALDKLSGTEESQIINYLKVSGLKVGLLINFGAKTLEFKRFVYTHNSL